MRRRAVVFAVAIAAALGGELAPPLAAQEPARASVQRVEVRVTSVAGRAVYLDHGRNAGLAVGTRVRLFAPGGPMDLEVLAVTATSARADVPQGIAPPPVGTQGEATVERAAETAPAPGPARPQNPDHPPWTRQETPRAADEPLLSPAFGTDPRKRPSELHGRAHALLQWNADRGGERDADWLLGRLGVDAEYTNPFGDGGVVRFAGEVDRRTVHVPDAPDDADTNARVDVLSYAFGTEEWAPLRVELGRFWSDVLPELGLVDGVEATAQFEGGWRFGAGLGSYPLPFPERDAGDDLGGHVFAEFVDPDARRLTAVVGAQKTWHRGEPDRDLLLARLQWNPLGPMWLYGNAKVDLYTGKDDLKSGVELTEALLQARADGSDFGGGVHASHFTWPQLLREEYRNLPAELVRDGRVDRLGADVWWRPVSTLRLTARGDSWRDQDGDGTAYDLALDWNDVLGSGTSLYASWFGSDGSFYGGPGWRLRARRAFGTATASVGYQQLTFATDDLLNGAQEFTRQSLDVALDVPLGDAYLSLTGERWFGDQEDGFAVAMFVQYRF